jgi:hypothetical protein
MANLTTIQLLGLCKALEPTFDAKWDGPVFCADFKRDGKRYELSQVCHAVVDAERAVLQSCYEQLNRGDP